jgi:hypothetical protein
MVGYAVDQVIAVGKEIKDSIEVERQKIELREFYAQQARELADYESSEWFQAAPADQKKAWYAEKFQQQDRAEKEKFVQEPHPLVGIFVRGTKRAAEIESGELFRRG